MKLTGFSEEVDESVRLAALVELGQLRAAVQTQVVDAEPPLPADGGVEQGTLTAETQNISSQEEEGKKKFNVD